MSHFIHIQKHLSLEELYHKIFQGRESPERVLEFMVDFQEFWIQDLGPLYPTGALLWAENCLPDNCIVYSQYVTRSEGRRQFEQMSHNLMISKRGGVSKVEMTHRDKRILQINSSSMHLSMPGSNADRRQDQETWSRRVRNGETSWVKDYERIYLRRSEENQTAPFHINHILNHVASFFKESQHLICSARNDFKDKPAGHSEWVKHLIANTPELKSLYDIIQGGDIKVRATLEFEAFWDKFILNKKYLSNLDTHDIDEFEDKTNNINKVILEDLQEALNSYVPPKV